MSISSLQNYEQDRMPQPKQLLAFFRAARAAGREDLAQVFLKALVETLGALEMIWAEAKKVKNELLGESGPDPSAWYERQALETVKSCLEGVPGYEDIAFVVMGAVARAVEHLESNP